MVDEDRKGRPADESTAVSEAESPVEAGASSGAEPERHDRELEEARAKADENWSQFLRARAELENARRRAERDVEQAHRYGLERLAGELLAVRDSLEMGVAAAGEEGADAAKLREGSELTLRMLRQAMEKFDIQELNPQGGRFDPERHEAMATQESDEHEPNTVVHVVQKGYLLGERLLRPAMVIVARAPAPRDGGQIDEQA